MSETANATGTANAGDFQDTPADWARRWKLELDAARSEVKKWQEQGDKIVKRFLDQRDDARKAETRWNLFSANIETMQSLLYGKTPRVSVSRKFSDAQDDSARVAGEMQERLLNSDIERADDGFAAAMRYALDDWLVVGMGSVRLRYTADFEQGEDTPAQLGPDGQELAPAVPGVERKSREDVETVYVYWKDQLWSPSRTFHDARWWAFKAAMSREQVEKRFGAEIAAVIPYDSTKRNEGDKRPDPWARADVWEVWSKEHREVFWFVDGYPNILDRKKDPLELKGFWPFPMPLVANTTTTAFVPRADFVLAQDIYDEIDRVSTRISRLQRSIKVVGIYDSTNAGLKRLVSEALENDLLPVDNWGALREKGGLGAAFELMPLDQMIAAVDKLREYRSELVSALYQITGMSDIMRGQASGAATATEQEIKAKFGSVRVQRKQEAFARFASEAQAIRSEIIARHYDPQTIVERSNVLRTADAQHAQEAVALIKDPLFEYRVEVKPEAVSLTDYAATKQERTEVIGALANYFQSMMPVVQAFGPAGAPLMLQMAQWLVAGLKGASTIEGVLDQAVAQAQAAAQQAAAQPPQQPPPDPKLQAAQVKAQAEGAKAQTEIQKAGLEGQIAQMQHGMQVQKLGLDIELQKLRLAQAHAKAATSPVPGI